jgi:hypothetical protein
MLTSNRIPDIAPGTLIAERSNLCPDCRAGVRFICDVHGRPLLRLEHDDGCPMLAAIKQDAATQPDRAASAQQ